MTRQLVRYLRQQQPAFYRVGLVVLLLVPLAVTAWMLRLPFLEYLRERRADVLIAEARAQAAAGKWREAGDTAAAAALLRPASREAVTLEAAAYANAHDWHAALPPALSLAQDHHATAADWARVAEIQTALGHLLDAAQATVAMDKLGADADAPLRWRAKFRLTLALSAEKEKSGDFSALLLLGRVAEPLPDPVVDAARALAAERPGDGSRQLLLACALVNRPELENFTEGAALLQTLGADRKSPLALAAWRRLAGLENQLDRGTVTRAATNLENHPRATTEDILLAWSLRIRLDPAEKDTWIAQATDRYPADPALAPWLLRQGRPELVVNLIPASQARTNGPALLLRLEALETLGRYAEAYDELTDERTGTAPPARKLALLAMLARRDGRRETADRHWQDALDYVRSATSNDDNALRHLATLAADRGFQDYAFDAWSRLTRGKITFPPGSPAAAAYEAYLQAKTPLIDIGPGER